MQSLTYIFIKCMNEWKEMTGLSRKENDMNKKFN